MPTFAPSHVRASDHLAQHHPVQVCLRALQARGWQERLAPLAKHLADHNLVRSRAYDGAFQRHIDPDVLREALSQMLREQWEDGYLIVALLVEEREPALVARALGVSQGALLEFSRDALADLGIFYEDAAFAALGQGGQSREQTRGGKRR